MELASNDSASPQVRTVAHTSLGGIVVKIKRMAQLGQEEPASENDLAIWDEINRFLNRPDATNRRTEPLPAPPGDPIGSP
jgi:hypothetical protein